MTATSHHAHGSQVPIGGPGALQRLDVSAMPLVTRLRYLRIIAGILVVLFLAFIIGSFAGAKIEWAVVGQYLFSPLAFKGLGLTILMTVLAMVLGLIVAVGLAVGYGSPNPVLRWICKGYVWLFRGTPQLLQLLIWYNLALVFPYIGILGIWQTQTVPLITPFVAALIGLGLNAGAYMSEIIRAGLLSVDVGQYEAAKSIGMPYGTALRKIIFPQAMRVIIPPIGNEFIGMTKNTSLASVIGFGEMLFVMQSIYFYNFKVIEMLMVSAFWYLVLTSVLSAGQGVLERHFGRGFRRESR